MAQSYAPLFVVIGKPGSGKSTQCRHAKDVYGGLWLSVGQLLRDHQENNPQISQALAAGELVDDDIVLPLVTAAVRDADAAAPIWLDGFPRSEADVVWTLQECPRPITAVFVLTLDDATATSRLLQRGREDDSAAAIAERLEIANEQLHGIIAEYQAVGVPVHQITATPPEPAVFGALRRILEEQYECIARKN